MQVMGEGDHEKKKNYQTKKPIKWNQFHIFSY